MLPVLGGDPLLMWATRGAPVLLLDEDFVGKAVRGDLGDRVLGAGVAHLPNRGAALLLAVLSLDRLPGAHVLLAVAVQHARLPPLRGRVLHLRAAIDAVAGLGLNVRVPGLQLREGLPSLGLLRADRLGLLEVLLLLRLAGGPVRRSALAGVRHPADAWNPEGARKALLLPLASVRLVVQILRAARGLSARGLLLRLRLVVGVVVWRLLGGSVDIGPRRGGLVVRQSPRGLEAQPRRKRDHLGPPLRGHHPSLLVLGLIGDEIARRVR